jgi:hypothetical protein
MPFQNHTVVDFQALYDAGAHWYAQLYYGDMAPADESAVLLEIIRDFRAWALDGNGEQDPGLPVNAAELVHPFYDGLKIAADQRDGSYFTAERIPGVFTVSSLRHPSIAEVFTKTSLRAHYRELAKQQEAA